MQARSYMTMTFAVAAILTIILSTGAGATDNATVESPEAVEKSNPPATVAEESTDPAKVVVAVVNGTEITMAPVFEEMNRVGQLLIRRQGRVPSADETAQIKKEAIDSMIFLELAHGYGRKHFTVEPAEIDGMVAQLRQRLNHLYEEYLHDKGLTEESLRAEIERRLLIQKAFAQEVDAKAGFEEEEARKEYAAQPELFTIPARIEVDDLFIASGADKEGAAARAAALVAKLRELQSVEKLSGEEREGVEIATATLFEDKDADLFREAAALEIGGVANPVEVDEGYHVMLVRGKESSEAIPFDKARQWFEEKAKRERAAVWLAELKKGATIEMRPDGPVVDSPRDLPEGKDRESEKDG